MLYHYCSLESFINIMKNKSFWLSDVRKSNDRDECMHLFKFLKARIDIDEDISNELKDLSLNYISDYVEQYSYGKGIRKYLPSREFEIANIVEGDEYSADLRIPPVHVLCLSEEGNLLSQWRGYADDGGGIAIGLREEFLDQTGDSMFLVRQDDGNYKFLRCEKIHYDDLVTLKAMESTRLSVYDNCKEQLKLINNQECSPEESEMLETLKEGLWNLLRGIEFRGITYKGDGFSEEKEHRIIEVDPHDFNPSYSEIEKQKNVLSKKR